VLVDDGWRQIAPLNHRSGPTSVCADSELITMALIGECKGWDEETVLISEWAAHRDLLPHQSSRTRFNGRRRQLQDAINQLRRLLTASLDFTLAPANAAELQVGAELLEEHTDLEVLGDKAFISAPIQVKLAAENRLILRTLPRANQRVQTDAGAGARAQRRPPNHRNRQQSTRRAISP